MWWSLIIVGAILLVILFFMKIKHLRHRTSSIFLILFVAFIYISVTFVVSKNNINLKTIGGVFSAIKFYFVWLWNSLIEVKNVTGNIINHFTNSTGA